MENLIREDQPFLLVLELVFFIFTETLAYRPNITATNKAAKNWLAIIHAMPGFLLMGSPLFAHQLCANIEI